jgi:hypothetical protein
MQGGSLGEAVSTSLRLPESSKKSKGVIMMGFKFSENVYCIDCGKVVARKRKKPAEAGECEAVDQCLDEVYISDEGQMMCPECYKKMVRDQ